MTNFAGFRKLFLTACLFVIFEISHQSCSPLHSFFEIPKLLKNTGQNWATYFFTITKVNLSHIGKFETERKILRIAIKGLTLQKTKGVSKG